MVIAGTYASDTPLSERQRYFIPTPTTTNIIIERSERCTTLADLATSTYTLPHRLTFLELNRQLRKELGLKPEENLALTVGGDIVADAATMWTAQRDQPDGLDGGVYVVYDTAFGGTPDVLEGNGASPIWFTKYFGFARPKSQTRVLLMRRFW